MTKSPIEITFEELLEVIFEFDDATSKFTLRAPDELNDYLKKLSNEEKKQVVEDPSFQSLLLGIINHNPLRTKFLIPNLVLINGPKYIMDTVLQSGNAYVINHLFIQIEDVQIKEEMLDKIIALRMYEAYSVIAKENAKHSEVKDLLEKKQPNLLKTLLEDSQFVCSFSKCCIVEPVKVVNVEGNVSYYEYESLRQYLASGKTADPNTTVGIYEVVVSEEKKDLRLDHIIEVMVDSNLRRDFNFSFNHFIKLVIELQDQVKENNPLRNNFDILLGDLTDSGRIRQKDDGKYEMQMIKPANPATQITPKSTRSSSAETSNTRSGCTVN